MSYRALAWKKEALWNYVKTYFLHLDIATSDYRLKTINKQTKMRWKSPKVVKHVVKCEKWACSTLEEGKNKPICYIVKMRDFKRFCEKIKEKTEVDWSYCHSRNQIREGYVSGFVHREPWCVLQEDERQRCYLSKSICIALHDRRRSNPQQSLYSQLSLI